MSEEDAKYAEVALNLLAGNSRAVGGMADDLARVTAYTAQQNLNALRTTQCVETAGARYLDPKSLDDFSFAEKIDLRMKNIGLIRRLEEGDVLAPSGSMSAKLMGELTVGTGREVGLIRVDGRRILRLGSIDSIDMQDAEFVIAHTHPSGILQLSGRVGGSNGDIPAFLMYQPHQGSTLLIGPSGDVSRVVIPRR